MSGAAKKHPDLILAAGTSLERRFSSAAIQVGLICTPYVSSNAKDWSALDFGGVFLVFTEQNGVGELMLVTGENLTTKVGSPFILNAKGYSEGPLTVELSRTGSLFQVDFNGESFSIEQPAATNADTQVILSAGQSVPWEITNLVVVQNGVETDFETALVDGAKCKSDNQLQDTGSATLQTVLTLPNRISTAMQPVPTQVSDITRTQALRPHFLEMFSPPAARFMVELKGTGGSVTAAR